MHIQLRQSGFLLRNIRFKGFVHFIEIKIQKTETKTSGADSRPTVTLQYLITIFCWQLRPKPSSIRSDRTQPAFKQIQNLIYVRLSS